ncbi:MAG: hypothetical protein M1833_006717 [Piccolia ochrophora]|nr:MAG: hypothetical protein M1833_006717 [Piccolia ochrophora]
MSRMLTASAKQSHLLWRSVCLRNLSTKVTHSEPVRIIEVGPRDGLQNEKNIVPLNTKIELIERLSQTGLRDIEAGAFVSPKWVPQVGALLSSALFNSRRWTNRSFFVTIKMANSPQILQHLLERRPCAQHPISYSFLVPNLRGLQNALAVSPELERSGISSSQDQNNKPDEISVFAAATETFSQKNTNCSITASLERFQPVFAQAKTLGIRIRAYISVVMGCPYEGSDVDPARVTDLTVQLLEMGADEVSLGDTTGMGTVTKTSALLDTLSSAGVPYERIALHLHDTFGQALANALCALDRGIRSFDSSVAGLGGCPYAKGATGNVATEDLVYLFHGLGLKTGLDLDRLAEIGAWISDSLDRGNSSRAGKAIIAKRT